MCGMVDLANNEPNEETDDEAKEVLVFMLVGIRGCWRAYDIYGFNRWRFFRVAFFSA